MRSLVKMSEIELTESLRSETSSVVTGHCVDNGPVSMECPLILIDPNRSAGDTSPSAGH